MKETPSEVSGHDLEVLFAKARALPAEHRVRVADALIELTREGPFVLSQAERDIVEAEAAGARQGQFAAASDVAAVLGRPWQRSADNQ